MFFLNKHETCLKFFVHGGQNQLSFTDNYSQQTEVVTLSTTSVQERGNHLISIKVPDTQIYLKTTNRGFLNYYETSSKVCVHDGQNRLSFQRQL